MEKKKTKRNNKPVEKGGRNEWMGMGGRVAVSRLPSATHASRDTANRTQLFMTEGGGTQKSDTLWSAKRAQNKNKNQKTKKKREGKRSVSQEMRKQKIEIEREGENANDEAWHTPHKHRERKEKKEKGEMNAIHSFLRLRKAFWAPLPLRTR